MRTFETDAPRHPLGPESGRPSVDNLNMRVNRAGAATTVSAQHKMLI